jgi:hypothetical protein
LSKLKIKAHVDDWMNHVLGKRIMIELLNHLPIVNRRGCHEQSWRTKGATQQLTKFHHYHEGGQTNTTAKE